MMLFLSFDLSLELSRLFEKAGRLGQTWLSPKPYLPWEYEIEEVLRCALFYALCWAGAVGFQSTIFNKCLITDTLFLDFIIFVHPITRLLGSWKEGRSLRASCNYSLLVDSPQLT